MISASSLNRPALIKLLETAPEGQLPDKLAAETLVREFPPQPTDEDIWRRDMGRGQAKGWDQHWTPPEVFATMFEVFGLTREGPVCAYDPGLGTGSAWWGLSDQVLLSGVEIDPDVVQVARRVYPRGKILQGNLAHYQPEPKFDVAGGMPPFRLETLDRGGRFRTAGAEGLGPSQGFYIENALRATREGGLAVVLLPHNWHTDPDEKPVVRAAKDLGKLVLRVALPLSTFPGLPVHDIYVFSRADLSGVSRARCAVDWAYNEGELRETLEEVLTKDTAGALREAIRIFRDTQPVRSRALSIPALDFQEVGEAETPLPLTESIEARLIPGRDRTRIIPNGRQARIRLAEIKQSSGQIYDAKRGEHTTRWEELLREPWEYANQEIVNTLRAAGIQPVLTRDQKNYLEKRRRWLKRHLTPFEQWIKRDGEWVEVFAEQGVRTQYPEQYQRYRKRLKALGMTETLYPYQIDDIARMALKDRLELGSDVGVGKSIEYIGYVLARDIQRAAIGCNSRLIGKWVEELEKWQETFPHLELSFQVIEELEDIGEVEDGRLKNHKHLEENRFFLLAYEKLWRIPKDSRHYGKEQTTTRKVEVQQQKRNDSGYVEREFWHPSKYSLASELSRAFANGSVLLDEAYRLKNENAKQTQAIHLLQAECRIAACATMIKNYVDDILPILNYLFGERTTLFRHFGLWKEGEIRDFVRRYGTYVHYTYSDENRSSSRKMIPKIARPEEFRRWHAPMQLRRRREEPPVAPYAGAATPAIRHESLPLTDQHRQFYEDLQHNFTRWWEEYLEEQEKQGRDVNPSRILAKLRVLQTASTCPSMESLTIDGQAAVQYEGGLTHKMKRCIELVKQHTQRGEKVVVFGQYKEGLHQLADHLEEFNPVLITGDVPLRRSVRTGDSKRDRVLRRFRKGEEYEVLLASQKCMSDGYDLHEASVAIFVECDWTPSVDRQALGRLRRPQQDRPITCYILTHAGTVDEYVALISQAKGEAHREVLDGVPYELKLDLIPDVQDYANGLCQGLSLEDIQPTRQISRIVAGDVEIYNAQQEGLIRDVDELERVFTRKSRFAHLSE